MEVVTLSIHGNHLRNHLRYDNVYDNRMNNLINGVKECAVVAKYNDNLVVKTIKAFVVVDGIYDDNYIRLELEKLVPIYMVPKTIKIVENLPISQNGKIDRKALSEL